MEIFLKETLNDFEHGRYFGEKECDLEKSKLILDYVI